MLRRYEHIKFLMELEAIDEEFLRTNGYADRINDWRRKHVRQIRDEIRRIDNEFPDRYGKPITEGWRGQIDPEYGESGKTYRIMPVENPDDWTDEEIEDFIMSEVGYGPINSPYDCTGQRFTAWTSWSRQPCGIVMIHAWGLDV